MRLRRRKPLDGLGQPLDGARTYAAWMSFATADTGQDAVRRGTVLRGDALVVRRSSSYFVPADTPEDAWPDPWSHGVHGGDAA